MNDKPGWLYAQPGFMAPPGTLEKKPPHGAPCNQCGLCCIATLCPLGIHVFKTRLGPCPALEREVDGKRGCGLVATPERHATVLALVHGVAALRAAALAIIGAGAGCDARFNGEAPDPAFYRRLNEWDRLHAKEVRAAKKLWGMP